MIKNELKWEPLNVCNLQYLTEMMGGKNNLIKGIIETFLQQVPDELNGINTAIEKTDYQTIKSLAHTMKSSVSIMGISLLIPILQEMENLGTNATDIGRVKELSLKLNLICQQAFKEVENAKNNYI
ncbi:MAG TPA: Hpt domain-containing protein [Bacteroidia bacterium]|jgi:HPt (histidine-containing phosphotransfer) domain-containing protein|nr:Hpt domain-containing protein [Bacteroidia bacterium]